MTSLLPPDRFLPGLAPSLDERGMMDLVAAHLPDCRTGELVVLGCQPRYLRYKPETRCLVQYDLILRDRAGTTHALSAHISIFADDRGQRRWKSGRMARLIERTSRRQSEPPHVRAVYLADLHALLQIYPIDYDLRRLERATDPRYMSKVFRDSLPASGDVVAPTPPALLRYKPERKALLRFALQGGSFDTLYAKLHTHDRGALLLRATESLIQAGVATPRALIHVPRLHLIGHEEAAGIQLASRRGNPDFTGWMVPLALVLTRLQSIHVPNLPEHRLADEAATIARTTQWLSQVAPHLASRLTRLGDQITSSLAAAPERMTTIHGDFYDDQALVSEAGVVLIDLDELRRGHPLLDIGNMLAHLTSGQARGEDTGAAREAFLAVNQHRDHTAADVALFEAAALVKLAPGPCRRIEPNWPESIERIVRLAEMRLAQSQRTVAWSPGTGGNEATSGPVRDPALPQLQTLQNPIQMAAELGRIDAGRPISVQAIALIRHKPGRRAIVRYDIGPDGCDGGRADRLYAKTFASERGARVYQITRAIATAQAFGPDVALPEPVAFLPHLKLLVQRAVPGEPVGAALLAGDRALASRIATSLHRLHTSGLDLGREHDLAKELSPLPDSAARIDAQCPELNALASSCLSHVDQAGTRDWPWRWRPVHRDFYDAQILIHDGTLAVLDLDDAAMSEPAVDVANFAAHLRLLGVRRWGNAAALFAVERAAADRYRTLDPDLNAELLRFLTATTLFRLAGIHVQRSNGARVARLLLESCDRLLRVSEIPIADRV
ncbi:MAG: phosphotransferase [Chloroflexia bacterium]|nr:phosphotransferase [Chloroflexia bacterium]